MTDQQFVKMHAGILRRTDLRPGPKLLYARLADLAAIRDNGVAWPTQRQLAGELGIHRSQLERWIAKLIAVALIRISAPGRGRKATRYELIGESVVAPKQGHNDLPVVAPKQGHKPDAEKPVVAPKLDRSGPKTGPPVLSEQEQNKKEEPAAPSPESFSSKQPEEKRPESNTEQTPEERPKADTHAQANLEAMAAAGLMANDRIRQIAGRPRCTPELVAGMAREWQAGVLVNKLADATVALTDARRTGVNGSEVWFVSTEPEFKRQEALKRAAVERVFAECTAEEIVAADTRVVDRDVDSLPEASRQRRREQMQRMGIESRRTLVAMELDKAVYVEAVQPSLRIAV